jgi:hypothetical protein
MSVLQTTMLFTICCVLHAVPGHAEDFVVDTVSKTTGVSIAFVVQTDRDPTPEWAVLTGDTLTISELRPGLSDQTLQLPEGATLFDLRDTDGDNLPELVTLRGARLEYWVDARTARSSSADVIVTDDLFSALSVGPARPYPLFFLQRGTTLLSVPQASDPRTWDLDGNPVPSDADEAPQEPRLLISQVWEAAPLPSTAAGAREFQVTQRFDRKTTDDSNSPPFHGARSARDATLDAERPWPWFPLRVNAKGSSRVEYAFAPPKYQDTLIRYLRDDATQPGATSSKRIPGRLILAGGRPPDVDGDGFADLVLWRPARPMMTLDALADAARSGTTPVVVTVHRYDNARGRYTGRPSVWFRASAPAMSAFGAGLEGPFTHVRFEDVNRDGRDELIATGTGEEIVAWRFDGTVKKAPDYRVEFSAPVQKVSYPMRRDEPWIAIVETPTAYHLLTLPQD